MNKYLLYILVGLIIVLLGLGFYLHRKVTKLEEKLETYNAELFTIRNYVSTEKKLEQEDPFIHNDVHNVKEPVPAHPPMNIAQSGMINDDYMNNLYTKEQTNTVVEESDSKSSTDRLNEEILNLKKDVNNIEDLLGDSSYEDPQENDIDVDEYERELNNIASGEIDDDLIEQVEKVKEVSQDLNKKNNSSEFEELANHELDHNSELELALNKSKVINLENDVNLEKDDTEKVLEESDDEVLEESDDEVTEENNDEVTKEDDEVSEENELIQLDKDIKEEVASDIINNHFKKSELEDLCASKGVSKSGNKATLIDRLKLHNTDFRKIITARGSGHLFKQNNLS